MVEAWPKDFRDIDFLQQVRDASAHVEDILYGKKTIKEVTNFPDDELERLYSKAQNALRLEDYGRAATLFQAVLVVNNKDQRALLGLAGALEGQHQYMPAMMAYVTVMMANFMDPVAPYRAGICLLHMDRKAEAAQMFELAADCRDEVKSPAKRRYAEKAAHMLKMISGGN